MSDQFIGEIRLFGLNFAPSGWMMCQGQLLSIRQYTALFSLLGTNYGGDGINTFGLPNLQGRVTVAPGQAPGLSSYQVGQVGGTTTVQLNQAQMASHTHTLPAGTSVATPVAPPSPDVVLATTPGDREHPGVPVYATSTQAGTMVTMAANEAGMTGGNQPHNNLAPYLVLNYCIALTGFFPDRQ
jgi:microcystin-dependent protein